jgi:hypothetical protein
MIDIFINDRGKISKVKTVEETTSLEKIFQILKNENYNPLLKDYNFSPISNYEHLLKDGNVIALHEYLQDDVDNSYLKEPSAINPPFFYAENRKR